MPNILQYEPAKDKEPEKRAAQNDLIGEQVMRVLGAPVDLLKVQVKSIGGLRYRVNVLVGAHAGSARVSNSYFIVADDDGRLISATPAIKKQY